LYKSWFDCAISCNQILSFAFPVVLSFECLHHTYFWNLMTCSKDFCLGAILYHSWITQSVNFSPLVPSFNWILNLVKVLVFIFKTWSYSIGCSEISEKDKNMKKSWVFYFWAVLGDIAGITRPYWNMMTRLVFTFIRPYKADLLSCFVCLSVWSFDRDQQRSIYPFSYLLVAFCLSGDWFLRMLDNFESN
jgi:hypothetical protein